MSVEAAMPDALDGAVATALAAPLPVGPGATARLADLLYARWYCAATEPPAAPHDVSEALRAAHAGSHRLEAGWSAERVSSAGRVLAVRGGEHRVLHPLDYVSPRRPGLPPGVGEPLLAVARREAPEPPAGFWLTVSPGWPPGAAPLVRVYWNVPVAAAPDLVRELTGNLLDAATPWALKLPADARDHGRPDAAVLYLPRSGFAALAPALAAVARGLGDRLLGHEPPLTLRLLPGVGVAENPGGAESFGSHRCRLIAEGLLDADAALDPREAIRARFARAGIDPDRPHLQPGSSARYALPPAGDVPRARGGTDPRRAAASAGRGPRRGPPAGDPRFRDAAGAIADRLVAGAIRHEDRCTWTGDALEAVAGRPTVVLRSCGGDLYDGTAGIAVFLAHAAVALGSADAAGTARAAARHALRHGTAGGVPSGLHEGGLGALWAVLEVARALPDEDLGGEAARSAAELLDRPWEHPDPGPDLLRGAAGTAVAALAIGRLCAAAHPDAARAARARARLAGETLLAEARETAAGWWWEAEGAPAGGLCGLAHGGSGVALALDALGRHTGDGRFAGASRRATDWERRWYSRAAGGWPDRRGDAAGDHPALWCHGATGIGLARLARWARWRDAGDLAEAGAALQAARAAAAAWPYEGLDWSICHGLGGIVELMLCAWQVTGHAAHLQAARALGARALADSGGGAGPWRCGVPDGGGETPGLMLGLAGIGTSLLRLHDPSLAPSPALCGIDLPRRGAGPARPARSAPARRSAAASASGPPGAPSR